MNVTNYKQFQMRHNSNVSGVNACMHFIQIGNSSNVMFINTCAYGRHETKVNMGAQMPFSYAIHTTPEDAFCTHLKIWNFYTEGLGSSLWNC